MLKVWNEMDIVLHCDKMLIAFQDYERKGFDVSYGFQGWQQWGF